MGSYVWMDPPPITEFFLLVWFISGNHSYYEFMFAIAVFCPEASISRHSSTSSGSYILSALSSSVFPEVSRGQLHTCLILLIELHWQIKILHFCIANWFPFAFLHLYISLFWWFVQLHTTSLSAFRILVLCS